MLADTADAADGALAGAGVATIIVGVSLAAGFAAAEFWGTIFAVVSGVMSVLRGGKVLGSEVAAAALVASFSGAV